MMEYITIQGPTQTLTLIGAGSTTTAISGIVNGAIRYIRVTNRGGGYANIHLELQYLQHHQEE